MHLFLRASAFSLLKETLSVNLCLLYLNERPGPGAHWSGLVTGFYTVRYIVGIFVTGFPNEASYLLISVCNELQLTPVTDTVAIPTVTCSVAGDILEPARIRQPPGAASWNQPGYGRHHSKEISQTHSHITDIGKARSHL
jgi:hypothetical protein